MCSERVYRCGSGGSTGLGSVCEMCTKQHHSLFLSSPPCLCAEYTTPRKPQTTTCRTGIRTRDIAQSRFYVIHKGQPRKTTPTLPQERQRLHKRRAAHPNMNMKRARAQEKRRTCTVLSLPATVRAAGVTRPTARTAPPFFFFFCDHNTITTVLNTIAVVTCLLNSYRKVRYARRTVPP